MKYQALAIAALCSALVVLPAAAQRGRGMMAAPGRVGGMAPRMSGAPRSVFVRPGFAPRGIVIGHFGGGGINLRTVPFPFFPGAVPLSFFRQSGFGFRRFHHNRFGFGFNPFFANQFGNPFFGNQFGFGNPFFGNAFWGGGYGGYFWPSDYSDTANDQALQTQQRVIAELEDQLQRQQQLYRMQRDAEVPAERVAPPPAPSSAARPEQPIKPTVLVFRDRHQLEVGNYAIVGETLYYFAPQQRRKVTLSELDLPATVQVNEERGVEFRVPGNLHVTTKSYAVQP